jgi:hypothetical protein
MRKLINPMIAALKELKNQNVNHRAIRVTNMFWATPEKDRIVLGDGAMTPPAFEQPALFETISSGMCLPAGRGAGTFANDVYCFGACLAVLMRGRDPAPNLDDDTIVQRKLAQGSYSVLVGDERLPLPMIELLRGLLCDDVNERWTTESLEMWVNGRRLSPLLAKVEKRASRGFSFANKEFGTMRELAIGLSRSFEQAAQAIMEGKLELWLRRTLDQSEKADAIELAVRNAALLITEKRYAYDLLVVQVCLILDNDAPVRYKGLSFMPDGVGWLLAVTMIEGSDIRILCEALMREVPKIWFQTRDAYSPDNSVMEANYRDQRQHLERSSLGNGAERVLYDLNDSMPCLSPFCAEDYVIEIRDLLPALNAYAKKHEPKGTPIDRHIAAFIVTRTNFDVSRQMSDLLAPDHERSTLGILNILALLQWRLGQGGLYHLANWVGGLMGPVINSFHSREKRKEIEKEAPKMIRDGSLIDLARLLDSIEEKKKDRDAFEAARMEYSAATQELAAIEAGESTGNEDAVDTAQQVAALISVTISFITVALLVLNRVL